MYLAIFHNLNIAPYTVYIISGLTSAVVKSYGEKNGTREPNSSNEYKPLHDWTAKAPRHLRRGEEWFEGERLLIQSLFVLNFVKNVP